MDKFVELVRALGDAVGLKVDWQPLSPIELSVDGLVVVISFERRGEADAIVIHSDLGEVPAERELEVYRVLLEANVMWSATGDATLAVNSATRQALMCYRMTIKDLDGPRFVAIVSTFAQLARGWSNVIGAAEEELAAATTVHRQGMIAG